MIGRLPESGGVPHNRDGKGAASPFGVGAPAGPAAHQRSGDLGRQGRIFRCNSRPTAAINLPYKGIEHAHMVPNVCRGVEVALNTGGWELRSTLQANSIKSVLAISKLAEVIESSPG